MMLLVVFLPPTRRNTALQRVRPTVQLVKRSVMSRQSRARRSVQQKKRGVQHFVAFLRASSSRPFYCKQLPPVLCLTNPHPSKVFFKKLRRSSTPCTTPWGSTGSYFSGGQFDQFSDPFLYPPPCSFLGSSVRFLSRLTRTQLRTNLMCEHVF